MARIAINGLGRIGKLVARLLIDLQDVSRGKSNRIGFG